MRLITPSNARIRVSAIFRCLMMLGAKEIGGSVLIYVLTLPFLKP